MASIVKRFRERCVGTDENGKPIRERTSDVMWYAKLKTSAGRWTLRPTGQATPARARKWAAARCGCFECGGPENARRAEEAERAAAASPPAPKTCGELMDAWQKTLTNRSAADDRSRLARHVRPAFATMTIEQVTLPAVMQWIDRLRAARPALPGKKRGRGAPRAAGDGRLSDATIRHNLNLLSRFFSWAVERGHAALNPVRLIPTGKRPQQTAKSEAKPWISDDKAVRDLIKALAPPFREMFYLGNRSGLRPGEQRALRMSDFGFLAEGVIRVRYSDNGCLKEDKRQEGKVKWVPAPDDVGAVLGPWLAKREAEGAQPEDLAFMPELTRGAVEQRMRDAWKEATDALELKLTFYEGTRHSFTSRNLSRGASLDEVSAAIGHSSPTVTRRYYDHFVRRSFSAGLREGIGATPAGAPAPVLSIRTGVAHPVVHGVHSKREARKAKGRKPERLPALRSGDPTGN